VWVPIFSKQESTNEQRAAKKDSSQEWFLYLEISKPGNIQPAGGGFAKWTMTIHYVHAVKQWRINGIRLNSRDTWQKSAPNKITCPHTISVILILEARTSLISGWYQVRNITPMLVLLASWQLVQHDRVRHLHQLACATPWRPMICMPVPNCFQVPAFVDSVEVGDWVLMSRQPIVGNDAHVCVAHQLLAQIVGTMI